MIDLQQELEHALTSVEVAAQIKRLIREVVTENVAPPREDSLLNSTQAAEFLGMSPAALRKAAERGRVPCLRFGRKLRFRRDELLASVSR
jgi:excisionase family DNA binding protein